MSKCVYETCSLLLSKWQARVNGQLTMATAKTAMRHKFTRSSRGNAALNNTTLCPGVRLLQLWKLELSNEILHVPINGQLTMATAKTAMHHKFTRSSSGNAALNNTTLCPGVRL